MTAVRHDLLIQTIKSAQRPLQLSRELKHNDKLLIKNFNFYTLGPELTDIDFTDCILDHCNFSYQVLNRCQFAKSQLQEVKTHLTTFSECTLPRDFKQVTDEDTQWPGSWIDYMLACDPEKILQFQHLRGEHKIQSLFQSKTVVEASDHYHFTNKTHPEKNVFYNGWDMLIWIAKPDLAKCFDLIAPILYRWFHAFTLEIHDQEGDNSVFRIHLLEDREGKPVTYLNSFKLSDESLCSILTNIDSILKKHHVRAGKKSSTQGSTFSEYFSLQNRFDSEMKEIFSQAICDTAYNPINKPNPYANFLATKPPVFDASVYFTSLAASSQIDFATAIRLSLLSYRLNKKAQNSEEILQMSFLLRLFTSSEFLFSQEKFMAKPELFFADQTLDKLFNTIETERCQRNTQCKEEALPDIVNERLLQYFCWELKSLSQQTIPLGLRLENVFHLLHLVKKNHPAWQRIIVDVLTILTPFLEETLQNGGKPQIVAQLKKLFKGRAKKVQSYLDELESKMLVNTSSIIRYLKSQYEAPQSLQKPARITELKLSEEKAKPIYTGAEFELPIRRYEIEDPFANRDDSSSLSKLFCAM